MSEAMEIENDKENKKVLKRTEGIVMPFSMQLEIYYDKFFPTSTFMRWLGLSSKESLNVLERRELSFTLEGDIYIRYLSFKNEEKLKQQLISKKPIKIDIGAIYNTPPTHKNTFNSKETFKAEEKEFIIDIDMNDYDAIRTCCKEAKICHKCWKFLKVACMVLEKALTNDFGFENILWVFSGRRGIHCWVSDPQAKDMKNDARSAIIDYLSLISGNSKSSSQVKNNILKKHQHPSVKRAILILEKYFEEIVLKDQNAFDKENLNILETVLNMLESSFKSELIIIWNKYGSTSKEKWDLLVEFINTKKQEYKTNKKNIGKNNFPYKRIKYLKEEIILTFLYPRLDAKVSTDIGHLLKSPFCVHPKTGNVCVPFKSENLNSFNPFTAPTIYGLVEDFDKNNDKDYYLSKMNVYYEEFEDFVNKLEISNRKYLKEKKTKKENEGKIDF